jgi:phosphatidylserine synthase
MTARREIGLAALAAILVLFTAMLDPWVSVFLALALLLVEISIRWRRRR